MNVLSPALAQQSTFYEDFESTEEGQLPAGWTWYQRGGTNPTSHWIVSKYNGIYGGKVAWSNWSDAATEGAVDEDWLITPTITPQPGDYLIFDAQQALPWQEYGSRYHILVSTTTGKAPDAFPDTLATFTEEEFPRYFETLRFSLEAYANQPIHLAFVHENPSTDYTMADDWYLDNVYVRPLQPMTVFEATMEQSDDGIPVGRSKTHAILNTNVKIVGDEGVATIASLTFTTQGTTDRSQIAEAVLYYTGGDPFIGFDEETGTTESIRFGSVTNPGDTFVITGSQELPLGDNYFWLIYVFKSGLQLAYPYPTVDATFESVEVGRVKTLAKVRASDRTHPLLPNKPPNDNHADAIELSATPARYGSSNALATFEVAYEKLAYCPPLDAFGYNQDGFNTIWWHFKAPSAGWITADLSGSQFNTILVFQDTTFNQLACNDDIDDGKVQSNISDYPVTAGQDIYLRVSGFGPALSPNAAAGVVVLDFAFTPLVTGVEDPTGTTSLSPLFPNPTAGKTAAEVLLTQPGEVKWQVYDGLGRLVRAQGTAVLTAGATHRVEMDLSALPAGLYLVHMQSQSINRTSKLTVVR